MVANVTDRKRLFFIAISGAVVVVGAFGLRNLILTHRHPVGPAKLSPQQIAAEQKLVRLHTAIETHPSDPSLRWDLANFYKQLNLPLKAGEQLNVITQLTPNDMEARCALGDICLALKRYPQAEYDYRMVVSKLPEAVLGWQGLAAVLIKEHRYFEASRAASKAIDLNKNDPSGHLLLATAMLEYASQYPDPLSHAGDLKYARTELEHSLKVLPNNGPLYYQLGRACMGLRDKSHAVPYLERAYQLEPQSGEVGRMLAIAYRTSGRLVDAQKVAQQLIRLEPNVGMNYDLLGETYLNMNTPTAASDAVKACEQAVKLVPNDAYLNERLATAYIRDGNYASARPVLEHVIALVPNRPFAHLKLAEVYTRLGDPERAKQETRTGEALSQTEQRIRRILAQLVNHPDDVKLHLALAPLLQATGTQEAARDEYLTVLKLDPKNPNVPKDYVDAVTGQAGF